MPTGYQIKEQNMLHFVTLQVVEWVDIFTRQKYRGYNNHKSGFTVRKTKALKYMHG
ncbi:MAG: hypothetical protein H0V01_00925 [Bacteroidetes bacterium]|nr:hypothetical protein [Bacteroidota bacterium]HET6243740.1 hypothetical protein [Bacteroidia bacterium]